MDQIMKIMIVDDEMIVRESLLHWFEKSGHKTETASSGLRRWKNWEGFRLSSCLLT